MQHGRQLSGLGDFQTNAPYDPTFKSNALQKLETDDDVDGSGIFDDYGFKGTVNRSLGIFADHPNMPGYVQREVEFSPSKQVENMSSGAAVIYVPGGGMSYIDHGRDSLDRAGFPSFRPGNICPAGPIHRPTLPSVPYDTDYHVMADNVGASTPVSPISANADSGTVVTTQLQTMMPRSPADDTGSISRPLLTVGRPQRGIAPTVSVQMTSIAQRQPIQRIPQAQRGSTGAQGPMPVVGRQPMAQPVAGRQAMTRPLTKTTVLASSNQAPQRVSKKQPAVLPIHRRGASGLGDDASTTPISSYIVGGLLVGAAVAIAAGVWGKK